MAPVFAPFFIRLDGRPSVCQYDLLQHSTKVRGKLDECPCPGNDGCAQKHFFQLCPALRASGRRIVIIQHDADAVDRDEQARCRDPDLGGILLQKRDNIVEIGKRVHAVVSLSMRMSNN
jgi:hypothetical protein